MVTLTLQDKKALMEMLRKHYTINESAFIKAIAQNEEEEVELTLKAFSLTGKPQDDVKHCINVQTDPLSGKTTISNTKFATIQIDEVCSKLELVKAVKKVTNWDLKNAKDFVDTIISSERIPQTGIFAYVYTPFRVGPYERITVDQWKAIVSISSDKSIKWHYV